MSLKKGVLKKTIWSHWTQGQRDILDWECFYLIKSSPEYTSYASNLEYNFSYIFRHIFCEFCKTLENMNNYSIQFRTYMGPDFAETFDS